MRVEIDIDYKVQEPNVGPEDGNLTLWGDNYMQLYNGENSACMFIPDWLADGIRELVKNKIEQENNRGA